MVRVVPQLRDHHLEVHIFRRDTGGDSLIDQRIHGVAFGQALVEQVRERLVGGQLLLPWIAPDLMVEI